MSNVTVVAVVMAKPGHETEVEAALVGLLAPTRAEDGCLNYDLHRDLDTPNRFVFHENWTSRAHLDRHMETAHFRAGQAALGSLVDAVDIHVLERIG